ARDRAAALDEDERGAHGTSGGDEGLAPPLVLPRGPGRRAGTGPGRPHRTRRTLRTRRALRWRRTPGPGRESGRGGPVPAVAPLLGGHGGLHLVDVLTAAVPGGLAADGAGDGVTHKNLLRADYIP